MTPEEKQQEDLEFATRYKMGQATDSFGNRIDGSNNGCPTTGAATLVQPRDVEQGPPPDTQSHMGPAHAIDINVPHNPLDAGCSESQMDSMRQEWRRQRINRPSMSEQMARVWRDKQNIENSFPKRG